jgi:hypothetical protein
MEHFKSLKQEKGKEYRDACEFAIQQTMHIQALFAGDKGGIGLKAIDGITGYGNDIFDPDPYKSAYKAGKRAVSVILRDMIERDIKKAKAEMEKKDE